MIRTITLALLLALMGTASAEDTNSGNFLLPYCKRFVSQSGGSSSPYEGFCLGTVRTLGDTGKYLPIHMGNCRPINATNAQMVMVVVHYMEQRPEKLHDDFVALAAMALHDAWPCK